MERFERDLEAQAVRELREALGPVEEVEIMTEMRPQSDMDAGEFRVDIAVVVGRRLLALVEVSRETDTGKGRRLLQAARVLGAPMVLWRSEAGWHQVFEGRPTARSSGEGGDTSASPDNVANLAQLVSLASRPVRFVTFGYFNLARQLPVLIARLGWFAPVQICQEVTAATDEWFAGKGASPLTTCEVAIRGYRTEFDLVCNRPGLPLVQCILMGGMLEGILWDFLVVQGRGPNGRVMMGELLKRVRRGFHVLTTGGADCPGQIVQARNQLHARVFLANPRLTTPAVATNASTLRRAVQALNRVP